MRNYFVKNILGRKCCRFLLKMKISQISAENEDYEIEAEIPEISPKNLYKII